MTTDLSRIPEVHRERVQRLVTAAADEARAAARTLDLQDGDAEERAEEAARRALAPFLAIADKADAAAAEAGHAGTIAHTSAWADELAELDAPAEPPPGYWSTGVAVERKAAPAARAFPARFTGEDDAARLYGVLLGIRIYFPQAIGVLGDRLEPILEALRGPAAPDLAANAVQAVRAAQRAHLDSTSRAKGLHTGTVEARLDIGDADGLRVALDGLVRYLADKPAEAVRAVAELVKTLPVGLCPSVTLAANNGRAVDLLASFPGAKSESRDIPPSTSVWVTVDGVDFGAAVVWRPTPLERAHTAIELLPAAKRHQALRRLSRSYSAPEMCVKHDACRIIGDEVVWPDGERWPTDPDRLQTVQP